MNIDFPVSTAILFTGSVYLLWVYHKARQHKSRQRWQHEKKSGSSK